MIIWNSSQGICIHAETAIISLFYDMLCFSLGHDATSDVQKEALPFTE